VNPKPHNKIPGVDLERIQVVITSFGYGHGPAPDADLTLDTRRHLRDPHHNPVMRYLTGFDPAVRQHVLTTPGAGNVIANTVMFVRDLLADTADAMRVDLAVGCVGGRHRSVALAEEIAAQLRAHGVGVEVEHRDVAKPVIGARAVCHA
jgi:RNase adaptor protein for sRNA GlmZ degradation